MARETIERLQIKTAEQRFLSVLEQEFGEAPRVAQALLEEAQTCLFGSGHNVRPGQMRVILTRRDAGPGRGLSETPMTKVVWTVDAGLGDREMLQQHGLRGPRRFRISRAGGLCGGRGRPRCHQQHHRRSLKYRRIRGQRWCCYVGGGTIAVSSPSLQGDPAFVSPAAWDHHSGPSSAAIAQGASSDVLRDIDDESRLGLYDLGADEYWAPGTLRRIHLPVVVR